MTGWEAVPCLPMLMVITTSRNDEHFKCKLNCVRLSVEPQSFPCDDLCVGGSDLIWEAEAHQHTLPLKANKDQLPASKVNSM